MSSLIDNKRSHEIAQDEEVLPNKRSRSENIDEDFEDGEMEDEVALEENGNSNGNGQLDGDVYREEEHDGTRSIENENGNMQFENENDAIQYDTDVNSLDDNEWIQNCRDELKDSDALKIQETSFKDSFFDEGQKIYGEIRRLKGITRSKISLAEGKVKRATAQLRDAESILTNLHEEIKGGPTTDAILLAYLDANRKCEELRMALRLEQGRRAMTNKIEMENFEKRKMKLWSEFGSKFETIDDDLNKLRKAAIKNALV